MSETTEKKITTHFLKEWEGMALIVAGINSLNGKDPMYVFQDDSTNDHMVFVSNSPIARKEAKAHYEENYGD